PGTVRPAAPTTTAPPDDGPPPVLLGDGIGPLHFGTKSDEVLAGLTLRWGPPDTDTGWVPAASTPFGQCPGTNIRAAGWGRFSAPCPDGPPPFGRAGKQHFFSWDYEVADPAAPKPDPGGNRPPLHTDKGISVAATVAQLKAAYGSTVELFDDSSEDSGSTAQA